MVRWGAVARKWPVERFLPTTDLDLSQAERDELASGIHGWRQLVPWYLARFESSKNPGPLYCFGVAHGGTVLELLNGFHPRNMQVPHMHLFDSFEGLPAEQTGIAKPPVWEPGAFAGSRENFDKKMQTLDLPRDNYSVYEGWFKDTLEARLVDDGTFKPAAYVDIDADLYNSTMDILDFMFAQKLIRPGTLIGYDDWGDSDLWTAGESRAHKEVMAKYGVQCAQLFSWGEPPLIKKLFLVVAIAGS